MVTPREQSCGVLIYKNKKEEPACDACRLNSWRTDSCREDAGVDLSSPFLDDVGREVNSREDTREVVFQLLGVPFRIFAHDVCREHLCDLRHVVFNHAHSFTPSGTYTV